eukprot:gb/GECH01009922.1/.p1 GENE.gb/GECH01009922.1/~~gb/GECH01009922.1/.p1  ORF type:complete len:319 (+),score=50.94 gb/GECH01009922.1/:1-957(+)
MFLNYELWRYTLCFVNSASDICSLMLVCRPWYTCLADLNWKSLYAERWKHNYGQLIDIGEIQMNIDRLQIPEDKMNNYKWRSAFLWRLHCHHQVEIDLDQVLQTYTGFSYSETRVSHLIKQLKHLVCLKESYLPKIQQLQNFGLPGTSFTDKDAFRIPFDGEINLEKYYRDLDGSRIRHCAQYDILPFSLKKDQGDALDTVERIWKVILFHPETAQPFFLVFTYSLNSHADGETVKNLTAKRFPNLLDVINPGEFHLNDPILFSGSPYFGSSSRPMAFDLAPFLKKVQLSSKEFGILCRIFDETSDMEFCEEIIANAL